jgi:AraC-like DNA-binding protein
VIAGGAFHYRCAYASFQDISVGVCQYSGKIFAEYSGPEQEILLLLPKHGKAAIRIRGQEFLISPQRGIIIGTGHDFSIKIAEGVQQIALTVKQSALRSRLAQMIAMPMPSDLEFTPEVDLSAGGGRLVASIAEIIHQGLQADLKSGQAPLALTSLKEATLRLILETLPHRFSPEVQQATTILPRHVKRAIDCMRSNLSGPMTTAEIVTASGVSLRTLQNGFQQFKNTTLMGYLRHLRLEAVHEDLKRAESGQTIRDIALKWGIPHLGRMSAEYRDQFGEFPSETLAQYSTSLPCPDLGKGEGTP